MFIPTRLNRSRVLIHHIITKIWTVWVRDFRLLKPPSASVVSLSLTTPVLFPRRRWSSSFNLTGGWVDRHRVGQTYAFYILLSVQSASCHHTKWIVVVSLTKQTSEFSLFVSNARCQLYQCLLNHSARSIVVSRTCSLVASMKFWHSPCHAFVLFGNLELAAWCLLSSFLSSRLLLLDSFVDCSTYRKTKNE